MNELTRQDLIQRLKDAAHKDEVDRNDWDKVKPNTLILADWFLSYCEQMNLPAKFSRIIDKPIPGVSVSDSHKDRAFDVSLIGWTDADARECAFQCNKQFHIGAISKRDGQERECVFEPREFNKKGELIKERHLHFQSRLGA